MIRVIEQTATQLVLQQDPRRFDQSSLVGTLIMFFIAVFSSALGPGAIVLLVVFGTLTLAGLILFVIRTLSILVDARTETYRLDKTKGNLIWDGRTTSSDVQQTEFSLHDIQRVDYQEIMVEVSRGAKQKCYIVVLSNRAGPHTIGVLAEREEAEQIVTLISNFLYSPQPSAAARPKPSAIKEELTHSANHKPSSAKDELVDYRLPSTEDEAAARRFWSVIKEEPTHSASHKPSSAKDELVDYRLPSTEGEAAARPEPSAIKEELTHSVAKDELVDYRLPSTEDEAAARPEPSAIKEELTHSVSHKPSAAKDELVNYRRSSTEDELVLEYLLKKLQHSVSEAIIPYILLMGLFLPIFISIFLSLRDAFKLFLPVLLVGEILLLCIGFIVSTLMSSGSFVTDTVHYCRFDKRRSKLIIGANEFLFADLIQVGIFEKVATATEKPCYQIALFRTHKSTIFMDFSPELTEVQANAMAEEIRTFLGLPNHPNPT